jgi:hypothetical protein
VSSRFLAEQAFSAAASFDISASTSFPFGSPHGIGTAVANSSVPMIRVFSPTHFTAAHRGSLEPIRFLAVRTRLGKAEQTRYFNANRVRIERAASKKFDKRYFEADGTVMVKAEDL